MVSGAENAPKSTQMPQAPILGPLNMTHGSAESSSHLGNQNIAYNTELWNSKYYALLLSKYSRHLETDTKMLFTSLKHLTGFFKQHPLGGHPIEQFPTIFGVGSYIWNLLQAIHSLSLTTTIVNPKIQKNSNKSPTLPSGLQDSSQHVGESPDSLNLISRTILELVNKFILEEGLKLVVLQDALLEVLLLSLSQGTLPLRSSSSLGKSEEKSMGSDPKTPTVPRITTDKLSSKRLPSLKLLAAFPTLIPEEKASTMSWDDHVSAEEGRDLVFGPETAF